MKSLSMELSRVVVGKRFPFGREEGKVAILDSYEDCIFNNNEYLKYYPVCFIGEMLIIMGIMKERFEPIKKYNKPS